MSKGVLIHRVLVCYVILIALLVVPLSANAFRREPAGQQRPAKSAPESRQATANSASVSTDSQVQIAGRGLKSDPGQQPAPDRPGITQTFSQSGIKVELSIQPITPSPGRKGSLVEEENAIFQFRFSDTATGNPITGVHPAAWMDIRQPGEAADSKACTKKIASYLGQSILEAQPLDLNIYHVISLNEDASITVVDPRFSYGGTRLLAMVELKSPGEDWALTADQRSLFVSMPASNQIAAVDTSTWKVFSNIDVGVHPARIGLQPDEQYLWVANEGSPNTPNQSEIVAITAAGLKVAARIPLGRGAHDLAFSDDNRFVFVTNKDEATVSVIDIRKLAKIKDIRVGVRPVSIAFSRIAKLAYVACEGDGAIAAISGDKAEVIARMAAEPGLGQIRFAPGERFGLLVNPVAGKVSIFDASKSRIIQSANIDGEPDRVTFSGTLAYLRRRKSETVLMIPLVQIGVEGKAISVADFPGGQHAFGDKAKPSRADNFVTAPEENAILVANPGDQSIYYYMEGMAAPMGNFSNYGRKPRAILVVDRSLRERSPGLYSTVAKLRGAGLYEVALLLSSPRVVNCFAVSIEADPEKQARKFGPARIEFLSQDRIVKVGRTATLEFRLTDPKTERPISGLGDVQVLAFLAPGTWQTRQPARQAGDGIYAVDFVPPQAGIYYIYLGSQSLGLGFSNPQYVVLEARSDIGGQK